ncbi:RNA-directed DNA polymerase, eukaryota, Reverse transcriptase zinc-binding domain protein [Artemisia annua]|uniref:RNA-directed DNA polymerase, eukaryota, Reverse transcriptase zinc-binding domain protein n=1 Tax=Artemisia annua TaxID=35608 RepID=A0A2U1LH42_ARTAN|nr:RNA-directed DNA polymerase, eukaryota, Reverse transcriptase zinc-binding domain protein [Artemisia annua]
MDGPLKEKFPNIFGIDSHKDCYVREKWVGPPESGSWAVIDQTLPVSSECCSELDELAVVLHRVGVRQGSDGWSWFGSSAAPFSCNIFAWRSEMDRIPTASALARRNIHVGDQVCALCNFDVESSLHLFSGCGFSYGVWYSLGKWCGLDSVIAFDNRDLLELYKQWTGSKEGRKLIQGIFIIGFWVLWGARNDKIFNGKDPKVFEIDLNVKSLSFLWYKHRGRSKNIVWKDWVVSPLYMM